jgi:hypothetical protein
VCAIVGIVDSIVAARENGTKYGYPVGPNRELVALGAANLTSSLFVHTGSVPVFGSVTRESSLLKLARMLIVQVQDSMDLQVEGRKCLASLLES